MTKEQTAAKVEAIIRAELLLDDDEECTPDSQLVTDLGADSLSVIEVIMALEDEFDIVIPDDDAALWDFSLTVATLTDYVTGKLNG